MSNYLKGLADTINGVDEKESFTKELDISSIVPSSRNFYGIREIEELAASIKENGLMHNLVVRKKDNGTYEIISGERRYHALKSLNYRKVPCQVKEVSDTDAEIMLIQANVEQRELLPSEKMEGIKRLKAIYEKKKANGEQLPKGKTRDIIGKDMKISGVQVGRYQKIDKDLIEPLKGKIDKKNITVDQASTLSNLTKEEQKIIYEEIKGLDPKESKEEVEILINGIRQAVEGEHDKKTFTEIYPTKAKKKTVNESESFELRSEELKQLINDYSKVQLVINDFKFNAMLNIKELSINDITLEFYLEGQKNMCKIRFQDSDPNQFKRVKEIYYAGEKIEPKAAFKITFDTYLWFNNLI